MIVKKRHRRSDEELEKEARKYTRRVDFQNGSNSYYKKAWRKGPEFLAKICSHMDLEWEPKWNTIEEVQAEALKYNSRTDFARGSAGAYDKAQRMGWLDTVCAFMGEKCNEAYTIEELKTIVSKCKTREELREKYAGAHAAIYKRGLVDELLAGLPVLWEEKWDTFKKIHAEALKYKRCRSEFKNGSPGAWDAAIRLGILDQVCSHMKMSKGTSIPEQDILAAVRGIYPSAKKMVDRNVKIDGKPYIYRFEIDIFVPELKLGIEFDGTRYHSFKYMRKSPRKKFWSDDDINNYHEIKDTWFASKGIKILHIKEEDWDLDKEACIQKCLAFLRGDYEKQVA